MCDTLLLGRHPIKKVNRGLVSCHLSPESERFLLTEDLTMEVEHKSPWIDNDHNVLYSLPASLIHSIMAEWIDVLNIFKVDTAVCQHKFRGLHFDFLSSDYFYINRLAALSHRIENPDCYNPSADTRRLQWLLARNVKVREIEIACDCQINAILDYLKKFGEYVRGVTHFTRKFHFKYPMLILELLRAGKKLHFTHSGEVLPVADEKSQCSIIAAYCQKLTSYHCRILSKVDQGFARVLFNNPELQALKIEGDYDRFSLAKIRLPNLRQLDIVTKYDFDHAYGLPDLVRVAPNLEKLLLSCISPRTMELRGTVILAVAKSCPKLRSFGARRLHLGEKDDHLREFLQMCPNIVNLDLQSHFDLTDDLLIDALTGHRELYSINLRCCSRLTDRTLFLLSERFASTLQVLHLGGNGSMTHKSIETLRSKCTQLQTFHYVYNCGSGTDKLAIATILIILYAHDGRNLAANARWAQQLQVLDLSEAVPEKYQEILSALQLMQVAENCPKLHTVVTSKNPRHLVNYTTVKKAFPRLLFTTDKTRADFNVLSMPM